MNEIETLIEEWRTRADALEEKVRANPALYSERAIGEAQGYWRALREAAAALNAVGRGGEGKLVEPSSGAIDAGGKRGWPNED